MMSTNQKLEISREIRQWIGTGISIGSIIFAAFMFMAPNRFGDFLESLQKKFDK